MHTVLIIDDEYEIREVVSRILKLNKFETIEAESGEFGVELAKKHLPDVILCDVSMSGGDGYFVLKHLQQDPLTASIPFIFLTGMTQTEQLRKGMELGADDYLTKPITATDLVSAIQSRIQRLEKIQQLADKKVNDLRTNLTLSIPHELRTPLTAIIGLSKMIASKHEQLPPAKIAEMAQSIHHSSKRLFRTVENFLAYAQIELLSGDKENLAIVLNLKAVDTVNLITKIGDRIANDYKRRNDLSMAVVEANPCIQNDFLSKIVTELLDNAFKYSKSNTPVKLTARPKNDSYEIIVSDSGRGMTENQVKDVGAYMQFDRKVHEQQGSGLGLAITIRLAELHKGKVEIKSVPQVGTLVVVTLPL